MSRTMAAIALVLALVTGLVLGQIAVVVSPTAVPIAMPSRHATEQVRAFYDGMNRFLATGDDSFLHLLSPGFQDFTPLGPAAGDATDLLARLDVLRQSASPPRFSIKEIYELDNLVVVQVSTGLPETLNAAGLAVSVEGKPTMLEFVQLQREAIVARWSQDNRIPRIDHVLDDTIPIEAVNALMFQISHVAVDAGAGFDLDGGAPAALLIDQGSLQLSIGSTKQLLSTGDGLWIDPESKVHLANMGPETTTLWLALIGIVAQSPGLIYGLIDQPIDAGVDVTRFVWSTQKIEPSAPGELRLQAAIVTLPPGSQFLAHEAGLGESLAVVDGTLDATVFQGLGSHGHAGGDVTTIQDHDVIPAGDGIALEQGAWVAYRVTGSTPATLIVLAAVPLPA